MRLPAAQFPAPLAWLWPWVWGGAGEERAPSAPIQQEAPPRALQSCGSPPLDRKNQGEKTKDPQRRQTATLGPRHGPCSPH